MRYIKLTPALDSELTLADSRELISYLSELSDGGSFKLVIKSQGNSITLLLATSADNLASIKKHIYSITPSIVISDIKKSQAELSKSSLNLRYKFKRHYAYPLINLDQDDDQALSQLMRQISKVGVREAIEIEFTATNCDPLKTKLLRNRLLNGHRPRLNNPDILGLLVRSLLAGITLVVLAIRAVIYMIENLVYTSTPKEHHRAKHLNITDPKNVMLLDKLYEPLYRTDLYINIKAPSRKRAQVLAKEIGLSLNSFAKASGYQRFTSKSNWRSQDIYSLSDLAALYRFNKSDIRSGIYEVNQFKTLPIPSELKQKKLPGDLVLGVNTYQQSSSDLILESSSRYRHLYITGATGSGKSTLIGNLIAQDMSSNQGLSLIDPHGDLALDVLNHLPKDRLKDLIYFDPSDQKSMVAINLLEIQAKPGSPEYIQEADQLTESIISLFRKIFMTEDMASHRIEYILRNSIHTALLMRGSTIFTIFRLLTDANFRLEAIRNIKDPDLVNFWRNELGQAGEYQRVKMTAGVTSKIGRLLFSEPAKRVFSQPKSTLNIREVMDNKKILICNFSKGKLGEDGSKLFATAMLTKLQLAALGRVDIFPVSRADHYLYVDEFQNYAPSVLVQMLSEARKYGLYLTMAEQSPSQQDSLATNVILANVGNLLCFRMASPRDEKLLSPSFKDYLTPTDLNNLPAYNFYFKSVSEQVIPPTSGRTYPLQPISNSQLSYMSAGNTKQDLVHSYLNSKVA